MFESAKYIKLGRAGEWDNLCLADGTVRLGFYEVPHELGINANHPKIRDITPQDFELFVEILFSKSGWLRVSIIGETMKDIDLELELPITGERALVQVKSKTNQSEFLEYSEILQAHSADRNFFVYHTAKSDLLNENQNIKILGPRELAEATIRSGMIDWLIDRV